jgi:hypothetical protein
LKAGIICLDAGHPHERHSHTRHPETKTVDGLPKRLLFVHGNNEAPITRALTERSGTAIASDDVRDLRRNAVDPQATSFAMAGRATLLDRKQKGLDRFGQWLRVTGVKEGVKIGTLPGSPRHHFCARTAITRSESTPATSLGHPRFGDPVFHVGWHSNSPAVVAP